MEEETKDILAIDGGEIKTTDVDGQVRGDAIVFGSKTETDKSSTKDYFTAESYITRKNKKSFSLPLYYEHGLNSIKEEIGDATLTLTDKGWMAEAMIDLESESGRIAYEAVKTKQHGFSTGALAHMTKRVRQDNGANFLKQWVPGEISLTQWPAEPRARVYSIKSLANGELEFPPAWSKDETEKLEASNWTMMLLDQNGNKIWDNEDGTPFPHTKSEEFKKVEFKSTNGSVSYNLYNYDEDSGGFEINAYQWGGAGDLIDKIQVMLNTAKAGVKSEVPVGEEDFNSRVATVVKSIMENSEKSKEVIELTDQLKTKNEELAELKAKLETAEGTLKDATEDLERYKILAEAKETINNTKGK